MRISDKKVNRICKRVVELIQRDKSLKITGDVQTIEAEIKAIFIADLKEEDMIEEEAKQILEQYSQKIAMEKIDYQALLNKSKYQIAKKRGFVL